MDKSTESNTPFPPLTSLQRLAISASGFVFDPVSGHNFTVNETGLTILRLLQKNNELNTLLEKVTVAITGMNAKPDNPGPGLAVARCLRESSDFKGRIIGIGYDGLDPGLYLKEFCDAGYILPYPSSGDEALVDSLRNIQEKENINVMMPCLDAELPSMIRLRPVIEDMGFKVFLPTQEQFRLRNKDRLKELAQHAGIDCPETKAVTSSGFFHDCEDNGWTYPFVVKGLFYDAQVVYNENVGFLL